MADCIICLEGLAVQPMLSPTGSVLSQATPDAVAADAASSSSGTTIPNGLNDSHPDNDDNVAIIQVCRHSLHDTCLKEWTEKANSCPICRQTFHEVHVYDKLGGILLSTYRVEDKKQTAEFDPQAWIDENPEDNEDAEELVPCPVCGCADQEDVLLLCDGCDTPYHTHCIGLDGVPRGSWFCMECAESAPRPSYDQNLTGSASIAARRARSSHFFPRTRASMRRVRRRERVDNWQGAWAQIAGGIFDALDFDVDHDGDDALEEYRRSNRLRLHERQAYDRWQQRLRIADQMNAQEVFTENLPERLVQQTAEQPRRRNNERPMEPPIETKDERKAWGALDRARDISSPRGQKRKSRSVTASPIEPPIEPERKLKRPRTRRIGTTAEASSSKAGAGSNIVESNGQPSAANATSPSATRVEAPTFLSSLLREVEMSTPSDDENIRTLFGDNRAPVDPSSPGSSPTVSAHNSPRALSTTPPPHRSLRPGSPGLSSHIEPIYPPANYSPTRSNADSVDGDRGSPTRKPSIELRQPRPRRRHPTVASRSPARSPESSPTRFPLTLEMKANISNIVRSALQPHWRSSQLTADQYADINRDISRKLYEEVTDTASIDSNARNQWEQRAVKEVAQALADLKA